MLLIGFRGLEADEKSPVIRDIRAGCIGGVVLFDRDLALKTGLRNIRSPRQVKKLIASLQNAASVPLLVAVDQEGGQVVRLKKKHGFPETVSAQYLGDSDNLELTRRYAAETAAALAKSGFNLNFSPLVDLNINPVNPIIGKYQRSFSANPDTVIRHAQAVIEVQREHGVSSCLKHFPGHGSSRQDSHFGFTDVSDTWSAIELQPYREIIARGQADIIMTAHIFNRHLDPIFPATLSAKTITGLLRSELQFQGLVMADDLHMRAISDNYNLETTLESSINAGVDILLFANNQIYDESVAARAGAIITRLVETNRVSTARIDESCQRILDLKKNRIGGSDSKCVKKFYLPGEVFQ